MEETKFNPCYGFDNSNGPEYTDLAVISLIFSVSVHLFIRIQKFKVSKIDLISCYQEMMTRRHDDLH